MQEHGTSWKGLSLNDFLFMQPLVLSIEGPVCPNRIHHAQVNHKSRRRRACCMVYDSSRPSSSMILLKPIFAAEGLFSRGEAQHREPSFPPVPSAPPC